MTAGLILAAVKPHRSASGLGLAVALLAFAVAGLLRWLSKRMGRL
jgi:hypothetical protein